MTDAPISFRERLAQLKAEEAARNPSPPEASQPDYSEYQEFVPVLGDDDGISQERLELDGLMARIDILDAYARWCGKSSVDTNTRKREGIKISCPNPAHPDKDPSAWINKDKQLYFCGGCQEGGDKFDIAAIKFGINYKNDPATFVDLKKKMAADYGYTVKTSLTGQHTVEKVKTWEEEKVETPSVTAAPTPKSAAPATEGTPPSTTPTADKPKQEKKPAVIPDFELNVRGLNYPHLDWASIVKEDTFLDVWMKEMTFDDLPEEYYFFLGLIGIGAAVGRTVTLEDSQPVYPNLLCCLIGDTGVGKSRSSGRLIRLLGKALPYDGKDSFSKGTKQVPLPGSGEFLMKQFSCPIVNPANPKEIIGYAPVRGIVDFDEFSNLTTRSARMGSTLQQTLMKLYDGYVDSHSTGSVTHGSTEVEKPFTMGLATTQPRNIQHLVNSADKSSGFLNRWFFVTGAPKEPVALNPHTLNLDPSIQALKNIFSWAGKDHHVIFTSDGEIAYLKMFEELIRPVKLGTDPTEGLLSRLDLAAKKIMLLLCANEMIEYIDERIVNLTWAVLDYLAKTFMFVDGLVGNHEDANVQKEITDIITKHFNKFNRPIKKRELFIPKLVNQFGSDKIVRVMRGMAELGFLEEVEVKGQRGPGWKGYILTKLAPIVTEEEEEKKP